MDKYWKITYIFPSCKKKGRVNDCHIIPHQVGKTEKDVENHFFKLPTFNGTGISSEVAEIIEIKLVENEDNN